MRFLLGTAAAAAIFAAATPAAAQSTFSTDTAEARGVVVQPLTLTRVADLDFGTVVSGGSAGTVSIDANSGFRSTGGGVTGVPGWLGGRAEFQGAGTTGQVVTLTLNAPTQLASGANVIGVTSMTLDAGGATRTIGAGGIFNVGVGGVFAISANQPAGVYTADFQLTAEYQ